ncbi:muellerian-inhibiting factor [Heterodontus francisci]|uniref:muellerian-inhibiting factor n=1 Tax=Heterodontus francisci TaxID=7792 RepID=UPI00355AE81E
MTALRELLGQPSSRSSHPSSLNQGKRSLSQASKWTAGSLAVRPGPVLCLNLVHVGDFSLFEVHMFSQDSVPCNQNETLMETECSNHHICVDNPNNNIRKEYENVEEPAIRQPNDFPDLHSAEALENCSVDSKSLCDRKLFSAQGTAAKLLQSSNEGEKVAKSISSPKEAQGEPAIANRSQELDTISNQKSPHAFKEPVCRLQSDEQSINYLEVIGSITGYERSFIEDVVLYSDNHMAEFGICSSSNKKHSAILFLRNLALRIKTGAEMVRLMVLHLSEVNWKEYNLQLQFKVAYERDLHQLIENSERSLLVFYLGQSQSYFFESERGFTFSELQLEEHQTVCFNEETKYVILSIQGIPGKCVDGQLCIDISLKIRRLSNGVPMEKEELQQLLFGFDEKRFTRMTPALFFLIKEWKNKLMQPSCSSIQDSLPPQPMYEEAAKAVKRAESDYLETLESSFHTPSSTHGSPREFLRHLSRFLNMVLDYSTDQNSRPVLHLDRQTIESLPHQSLNISNAYVLELLVQSDEPLIFLLPVNTENFLKQIKEDENIGETEKKIQQLLITKLQSTIRRVLEIPIFQNEKVLKKLIHLLNECNYPFPLPQFPQVSVSQQDSQKKRNHTQKTYHTFLLLKTLQTVKTFWDKRQKLFRQNRSATNRSICKLEELSIDFERLSYNWILVPKLYNIHNCVGSCRIPLMGNVSNHVVLLIKMQEQGLPTKREPCCVPVEYSELLLAVVNDHSSMITVYKNMVAEECKCR